MQKYENEDERWRVANQFGIAPGEHARNEPSPGGGIATGRCDPLSVQSVTRQSR